MKILHFSDIHTGGVFRSFSALFDKRLIGTLNYKLRRRHEINWQYLDKALEIIHQEKPDIVINTGDLTSVSEPAEFIEALERLNSITGKQDFTFLNVPGNHDNYIHNPSSLKSRHETFDTLNNGTFPLSSFPHLFIKEQVVFILVDESRPNFGINSSGRIDDTTLNKVENWCDEFKDKSIILVGHYPLKNHLGEPLNSSRALENSERLRDLLEKGKIAVNLCGHIHRAFIRKEPSGSMEICAGSLTIGGKMNKLEFNQESNSFSQSWIDLK